MKISIFIIDFMKVCFEYPMPNGCGERHRNYLLVPWWCPRFLISYGLYSSCTFIQILIPGLSILFIFLVTLACYPAIMSSVQSFSTDEIWASKW